MCGIVCTFNIKRPAESLRQQILNMSKTVRHRGPDWSGIFVSEKAILAHERLAIVDPKSGRQPLFSKDGKLVLAVNGEIYNHRDIRKQVEDKYEFTTQSDCEVILALYREKGAGFLEDLNGIFAIRYGKRSFPDRSRPHRDHSALSGVGQGWRLLCGFGTQSAGRPLQQDRRVLAWTILLQSGQGAVQVVCS